MSADSIPYITHSEGNACDRPRLKKLRIHETTDDFLGFIIVNGSYMYASCIPTREAAERIAAIYEEVMP